MLDKRPDLLRFGPREGYRRTLRVWGFGEPPGEAGPAFAVTALVTFFSRFGELKNVFVKGIPNGVQPPMGTIAGRSDPEAALALWKSTYASLREAFVQFQWAADAEAAQAATSRPGTVIAGQHGLRVGWAKCDPTNPSDGGYSLGAPTTPEEVGRLLAQDFADAPAQQDHLKELARRGQIASGPAWLQQIAAQNGGGGGASAPGGAAGGTPAAGAAPGSARDGSGEGGGGAWGRGGGGAGAAPMGAAAAPVAESPAERAARTLDKQREQQARVDGMIKAYKEMITRLTAVKASLTPEALLEMTGKVKAQAEAIKAEQAKLKASVETAAKAIASVSAGLHKGSSGGGGGASVAGDGVASYAFALAS